MDSAPSKSTAGDALRDRENEVFKLYYFALIKYFEPLMSVNRKEKISFEKFYAFDSTTITLFSDVMKGVGRNPYLRLYFSEVKKYSLLQKITLIFHY